MMNMNHHHHHHHHHRHHNNNNHMSSGANGRAVDMDDLLSMSPPSNVEEVINVGTDNVHHETVVTGSEDGIFKKPKDIRPLSTTLGHHHHMGSHSVSNDNGGMYGESIGRPTREILSCIMTTSGFISPAREGKLPDATKPVNIPDDPPSPKPHDTRSNDGSTHHKSHGSKKSDRNSSANVDASNDAESSSVGGLKHSSASKKLLLAGIGKDKSANKKRKLPLSLEERKKAKKKMRLLQNAGDASMHISPSGKKQHHNDIFTPDFVTPQSYGHDVSQHNESYYDDAKPIDVGGSGMSPALSTPSSKKMKKLGERKHKVPKGDIANALDFTPGKPEKVRKKKTPKLSKKKLAAAVALGFISESALAGYLSQIVFTDEQLRLIIQKTAEMRGLASTSFTSPSNMISDAHSGHKYTDNMVGNSGYDSNDMNKYYQPPAMSTSVHKNPDKLSTEPDKRKLNIFKKISTSGTPDSTSSGKKSKKNANGMNASQVSPTIRYADFPPISQPPLPGLNDPDDSEILNMSASSTGKLLADDPAIFVYHHMVQVKL